MSKIYLYLEAGRDNEEIERKKDALAYKVAIEYQHKEFNKWLKMK